MTKSSSLGDAVARDNEAARRGELTNVPLVDVYGGGNRSPAAARFGVGARTIADIRDAVEKRQNQRPGAYRQR